MAEQSAPMIRTREELHSEVWSTRMSRLCRQYGLSSYALTKILDRLKIPLPPQGFWAKQAVGKAPPVQVLPDVGQSIPGSIDLSTAKPTRPGRQLPAAMQAEVEEAKAAISQITVSERITNPHKLIASWIHEREQLRQQAKRERQGFSGYVYDPGDFTPLQRRRHRILDALFKALEEQGATISQTDRGELSADLDGEIILFVLREKNRHVRRPMTEDEKRWKSPTENSWTHEVKPSGLLIFEFKTYMPDGMRNPTVETEARPLEEMLADIAAKFAVSWPLLAEKSRQRRAEEERHRQEQARRYEAERNRKREENRWRRLVEFAQRQRDVELARALIDRLKVAPVDESKVIDGMPLSDWIAWAEDCSRRADPLARGVESMFRDIASVNEWTTTR